MKKRQRQDRRPLASTQYAMRTPSSVVQYPTSRSMMAALCILSLGFYVFFRLRGGDDLAEPAL